MNKIQVVTVVGGNGTMGHLVSAIFASFGQARVYIVSRTVEKSRQAIARAVQSVRADSIEKNLVPVDYSSLEKCVSESDLVFETVSEDRKTKSDINRQIVRALPPNAVFASGTSGLSITKLAAAMPADVRKRYMGIHFFNPPYALRLCELIPTAYTDPDVVGAMQQYLSDCLLRIVVQLKDEPAFLGNRIGFLFLNTAMQKAVQFKEEGGIDYIDAIFGPFTGRSMPPLVTSDFVGLDVHKAIVDNVVSNANDPLRQLFVFPEFAETLIADGLLGRKVDSGLYRRVTDSDGKKQKQVFDIRKGRYRTICRYAFPFADEMNHCIRRGSYQEALEVLIGTRSREADLCTTLLLEYILYSIYVTQKVGHSVADADSVMAEGFGWCPPLAWRDAICEVADFDKLVAERLDRDFLDKLDAQTLLAAALPSQYDYRPFIKAGGKGY